MKVCQINCIYGKGSTGKIVRDIHLALLKQNYDSIVIYPCKNEYSDDLNVYSVSNRVLSRISSIYKKVLGRKYDGAFIQTNRIINILKREKPDVVHLQCINGNNINIYRLLNYLSSNNISTIYTIHAEYLYTGGCEHAYDCTKMTTGCGKCPILKTAKYKFFDGTKHAWKSQFECYRNFNKDKLLFVAVSPWLKERTKISPLIKGFDVKTVLNGVDTDIFKYCEDTSDIRRKYNIKDDERVLLHVTTLFSPNTDNLKGGKYILQLAEYLKKYKIRIIVAANYGEVKDLPDNINYIGRTENSEELARLYSMADMEVTVSRRETFGMTVAESLCCGTPVVGFKAGGPESVALNEFCKFFDYGNVEEMAKYISVNISKPVNKKNISEAAIEKYSKEKMTGEYLKIYKSFKER